MFITAVCVLSLIKLRWPKNKSLFLAISLRKKKHDQMEHAEFNLIPTVFISPGIAYFVDFFASYTSFYSQIKFHIKNSSMYVGFK